MLAFTTFANMTKEETVEKHRQLWKHMAVMCNKREVPYKEVALSELGYVEYPYNECFCCEYAMNQYTSGQNMCDVCPILWDGISPTSTCSDYDSIYYEFRELFNLVVNDCCEDNVWRDLESICKDIAHLDIKE